MSRAVKHATASLTSESLLAELSISRQQMLANVDPHISIRDLVGSTPQSNRFVGRPWFVWKDDPDLARDLNDRLAQQTS